MNYVMKYCTITDSTSFTVYTSTFSIVHKLYQNMIWFEVCTIKE